MLFDDIDLADVLDAQCTEFCDAVAQAQHQFKLIHFKNSRLVEAVRKFEVMRRQLVLARKMLSDANANDGSALAGFPQLLLAYVAPSGSGKTRNIHAYIKHVMKTEEPRGGQVPLLYVELKPSTRVKDFLIAVLKALGDEFADEGTVAELWDRMHMFIRRKGVEVIFIDEFHNLMDSDSGIPRKSVLDAMKGISNRGAAAFVLSCVEKAMPLIKIDKELVSRQDGPLLMPPLDIRRTDDAKIFYGHLAALDVAMMRHEITDTSSRFLDPGISSCLYEATIFAWKIGSTSYVGTVVGDVSKIVGVALYYMHERLSGYPDKARVVTPEDLSKAIDAWAVTLEVCVRNPFRSAN